MSEKQKRILIGSGVLNWPSDERVGDRYGCVLLFTTPDSENQANFTPAVFGEAMAGRKGSLLAIPIETRKSYHIGDFCNGFAPTVPEVGEEITLGSGTIFCETRNGYDYVGLSPDDGRETFWLDPKALYRVHHQTVDLYFVRE